MKSPTLKFYAIREASDFSVFTFKMASRSLNEEKVFK